MEHEVFVPVPAERLREALADPVRVARAVPGLQQDAGTPPVSGRLKVRVGGHTITYRGALRVSAQDDGTYAIEADATEARGAGSVKLALSLRLLPTTGGTTLTFTGTASADGRVTELPTEAVSSAGARLLSRFGEGLGADVDAEGESGPGAGGERGASEEPEGAGEPESVSVFDSEVPPPALDPLADDELVDEELVDDELVDDGLVDDELVGEEFEVDEGEPDGEDAMAEAAHARRTMIGRSAEEVDHAPPRGRYAPVPPPEATAARATLRWAAPAAALALASAIVVTRVLRKRR